MSYSKGAHLKIPYIEGIIIFPINKDTFHIGRDNFKISTKKPYPTENFLPISGVRKDNQGKVTKQQFQITFENGHYYIEDKNSTNGTYIKKKKNYW